MVHEVRLADDSRVARLLGEQPFPINSLHHQSLKTIASALRPVGWAPDGVVEAVEAHDHQFMIGVQCHPEALQGSADPRWRSLFQGFIASCPAQV
jgi:putative glutamine amidotransferase